MELLNGVNAGQTSLASVTVGDSYGQYPQSAIDAFQLAINDANVVLADCATTSTAMTQALSDFQSAKAVFDAAIVNDPVLKIYSGYNFSGEEKEIYCGYYNGTLGENDDWAVSFTLEKGYMATFAEHINGTGASKVYVAADADLSINLPANLQQKVSFIRISPWRNIKKKGLGAKGDDVVAALDNSWYYNWGTTGESIGDAEFVPNQWGGGSIAKAVSLGERMDITHYMAFNEPDNEDQSNMTVDKAIEKYEELLASGLRLGSPANTDGAVGAAWRDEFMTKAEANGLRVDYMVVHYYKKTTPEGFYNWLKAIYDKWQRPIWIKEFNYGATWVSNKPTTNEDASDGLESYINKLDDTDFIERYAVFTWQPDNAVYSLMSVRTPVTLSTSGVMYRDHISPVAYTQEVYEQGEQLSVGDNSIDSTILIYPTVVKDGVLNFVYSNEMKNSKIELTIYNTMGQQIKKVSNLGSSINISNLSVGVYIVKIKSGFNYFTKKIIVN
ncbi:glycosyl hydrolase [Mariniflexile fucanivorans]|uniref:glycosyl hydrolase n=1 Tax=Mariniflexile fucanivorans TaxID=264023 RepID=UPI0014046E90